MKKKDIEKLHDLIDELAVKAPDPDTLYKMHIVFRRLIELARTGRAYEAMEATSFIIGELKTRASNKRDPKASFDDYPAADNMTPRTHADTTLKYKCHICEYACLANHCPVGWVSTSHGFTCWKCRTEAP